LSRRDDERLDDILASAQAIRAHLERGGLDDGLVFAGMRNQLAYRYFDTPRAIVQATIDADLPPLVDAVERLLNSFDSGSES
jgi:hypothetical protein